MFACFGGDWIFSVGIKHTSPSATYCMSFVREAILCDPSGNMIKVYWAGENRLNPPWRVIGSANNSV
jgi:hypothetical protein